MAVIILQFFLFMRYCFPALKCAKVQATLSQNLTQFSRMVARKRRMLLGLDALFGFLALLSVLLIFYADEFYTAANHTISSVIEFLIQLASSLLSVNNAIDNDNAKVVNYFNGVQNSTTASNNCKQFVSAISNNIGNIGNATSSFSNMLTSLQASFETFDGYVTQYGKSYQTYFIFGYFGLSLLLLSMILLGVVFQKKCLLQFHILASELYMLLLTLIVALLLVLMVSLFYPIYFTRNRAHFNFIIYLDGHV